jgi:hypothetical protein
MLIGWGKRPVQEAWTALSVLRASPSVNATVGVGDPPWWA